jgi:predicted ATPase/DNA-binding winged helix-turn-helix (wHTH) protein
VAATLALSGRLSFGPFTVDMAAGRLLRGSAPIALPPKAFDLLVKLLEEPGRLLTKEQLLDAVWGHRHLSDSVLKTVLSGLRMALDDDAKTPRWIETVPRRGYRFVGAVERLAASTAGTLSERPAPAAPPIDGATLPAGNLPPVVGPLIGRDAAAARLAALLEEHRLLTLLGAGGVGKTRLALAVAREVRPRWRDGAWWVELAPLAADADAPLLRATLAGALQLPAAVAHDDATLARALASLHALVVLDNAEHLVERIAPLLATIQGHAEGLTLLVTSQEPLRIPGEVVLPLAPLALPETTDASSAEMLSHAAVQLFVRRVSQRLPDFALTAHQRQAVASICMALDGLPLAIELAAACVPSLGVHGLLERLQGSASGITALDLPAPGWRGAALRHRSLRDALDWSVGLLTASQRTLFRRLSVFRGGFQPAAAEQVCSDDGLPPPAVLAALAALVDRSLVDVQPGGRCRLLEAPRAYAQEQLQAAGEGDEIALRHALWMQAFWAAQAARVMDDPIHVRIAAQAPELDNLGAALRWCTRVGTAGGDDVPRQSIALRLVADTPDFWHHIGQAQQGRFWCEQVRPWIGQGGDARVQADFAVAVAYLALFSKAYPLSECVAGLRQATALYAASAADVRREYTALYLLWTLGFNGLSEVDRPPLLARMRRLEKSGAAEWSPMACTWRRVAERNELRLSGQSAAYLQACHDQMALMRSIDARVESISSAQALLLALIDAGRVEEAIHEATQAVLLLKQMRRMPAHVAILALQFMLLAEHGDVAAARSTLSGDIGFLRASGTLWMAGVSMAWLAAREGRADDAARLLGWDRAEARRAGHGHGPASRRSVAALQDRLAGSIAPARMAALIQAGEAFRDEDALLVAFKPVAAAAAPKPTP